MTRAMLVLLLALGGQASAQGNPSFRVVNNAPEAMNEVYASPTAETSWGHDRLGNEIVAPGASHAIRLPADGRCRYDVRVVFQGGRVEERRDVDACAIATLAFGAAAATDAVKVGNPSFNLVNRGTRVIERIFASPSARDDWGTNHLGGVTVRPGASHPVRLPEGDCIHDIRVVMQGGDAEEKRRVDLCALTDFVVR